MQPYIPGDALVEGEKDKRDKVIQCPSNNVEDVEELEEPENQDQNNTQTTQKHEITHQNSIAFPTTPNKPNEIEPNESDPQPEAETETQTYGRGQQSRPALGTYRTMNNGLVVALVHEHEPEEQLLTPDFALIGPLNSDCKLLDEVLRGLDADKWQNALDYKINQLEKLGTWVVEDLPKGHSNSLQRSPQNKKRTTWRDPKVLGSNCCWWP